jgi:Cysteine dioxygenase type I
MFSGLPRSDALVPSLSVRTGAPSGQTSAHLTHHAGPGRARGVVAPPVLAEIAAGLAQTAPAGEYIWTEGTRRRYTRLLDTDCYDAWLIAWSASASLELHDHGGSHGAVVVAAGRLAETYTDRRWHHPVRTRVLDDGSTLLIPATRVHEVSNPGPAEALSVHVYSPPLRLMTFFDPRPESFPAPVSNAEGAGAALEEAAV